MCSGTSYFLSVCATSRRPGPSRRVRQGLCSQQQHGGVLAGATWAFGIPSSLGKSVPKEKARIRQADAEGYRLVAVAIVVVDPWLKPEGHRKRIRRHGGVQPMGWPSAASLMLPELPEIRVGSRAE